MRMRKATKKKLLLIGGGGHCHSVLDAVMKNGKFSEFGIIDKDSQAACLGVPVIGRDEDLPMLLKDGWSDAFVTVGSVGDTALRRRLYAMIKALGFTIPMVIDPSAELAKDVQLSRGVFVGKRAVVNAGAVIGECAIVNTGAIVEHDCIIGRFSHVSPGTVLCGQVVVGNDSHIGAGSVVRQCLEIGERSIIGIGSVVTENIPDDVLAYGNPCKIIKRLSDQ
jgi:sugar O-acyltransferase (sialic acid O-acetyltransferase NeuD family)